MCPKDSSSLTSAASLPGTLISFEGIDGCGKTTQISRLADSLNRRGVEVRVYREPGGNPVSEKIRAILLDPANDLDPVTEILLFSSARSELVSHHMIPDLKEGRVVILDRFYDSTTAYQGFGHRIMDPERLQEIHQIASHGLEPAITFYLKIGLDEAERRTFSLEKDRMESMGRAFFERVIQGYEHLAARLERFNTLDGTLDTETLHQLILERTLKLIKLS